jgi:hypothetical protein
MAQTPQDFNYDSIEDAVVAEAVIAASAVSDKSDTGRLED